MKINLVNLVQNKIYKNPINKEKPAQTAPSKSDFSLTQNIISNYSKAMISFGKKININELKAYIASHPDEMQAQIAEHFGVNQCIISNTIKQYGINYTKKCTPPSISKEELENYIAQNPNASQKEIAKHFKISVSTTSTLIRKYNIEYSSKYAKSPISKEVLSEYILNHPDEAQKQIAQHFGVTKVYIGQLIERFGIPYQNKRKTNVTPKQIQSYIKTHKDANLDEIAKHFGVSASYISAMIIGNNIKYHKKYRQGIAPTQEIKDYILDNPQATQKEIAKHFGLSQACINKIIIKYKLPYIPKKTKPI